MLSSAGLKTGLNVACIFFAISLPKALRYCVKVSISPNAASSRFAFGIHISPDSSPSVRTFAICVSPFLSVTAYAANSVLVLNTLSLLRIFLSFNSRIKYSSHSGISGTDSLLSSSVKSPLSSLQKMYRSRGLSSFSFFSSPFAFSTHSDAVSPAFNLRL